MCPQPLSHGSVPWYVGDSQKAHNGVKTTVRERGPKQEHTHTPGWGQPRAPKSGEDKGRAGATSTGVSDSQGQERGSHTQLCGTAKSWDSQEERGRGSPRTTVRGNQKQDPLH